MNLNTKKIVIKKPMVTEKTAGLSDKNIYTFEVTPEATKSEIKKEIFEIYKVKPVRVNIAKKPNKKTFIRGRVGEKTGFKKAYVYLKKGDTIKVV